MPLHSVSILDPTTAAKTISFEVERGFVPSRITVHGLGASETVALNALDGPEGALVPTPLYQDGVAVVFSATNPVISVSAPGPYQLVKGVTAAAVSAYQA